MWFNPPFMNRFRRDSENRKSKYKTNLEFATKEEIREEYVLQGLHFLSYPELRGRPDQHLSFLGSKGLNPSEIQECMNRLGNKKIDNFDDPQNDVIRPVTPIHYEQFLLEISKPKALDIYYSFMSFVSLFPNLGKSYTEDDKSKMVRNQINLLYEKATPLLILDGDHNKGLRTSRITFTQEELMDCIEKYLMVQLYDYVFCSTDESKKRDEQFFIKMSLLSTFLLPSHLDIPSNYVNMDMWSVAQEEFKNINLFKAPKEKLACILKACKIISSAMQAMAPKQLIDAELFLPAIIYNIIKSNVRNFKSNMEYLQYYHNPMKLMYAESGYSYVNMLTAIQFIEKLDSSLLTIDPQEYDRKMKEADENYHHIT